MNVYLVSRGCYSDRNVLGVFSSRENAQEFMGIIGNLDWNDIEKMELNSSLPQLREGMSSWCVRMRRNGDTESVVGTELDVYACNPNTYIWRKAKVPKYVGEGLVDLMVDNVLASGPEHAIKIANEHRAQMIANGEWEPA